MRFAATFLLLASAVSAGMGDRHATDRDVQKWIEKWQKRLDLPGWSITGRVAKASEMKPDVLGESHWSPGSKNATIMVLTGDDYDRYSRDVFYDQELTVVHELVHIRLSAVQPHADMQVEEKFVVAVSEAIFGRRAIK